MLVAISRLYSVEEFGVYAATVAVCGLVQLVLGLQLHPQAARAASSEAQRLLVRDALTAASAILLALLALSGLVGRADRWSASAGVVISYLPAGALTPYLGYLTGAGSARGSATATTAAKWLLPLIRVSIIASLPFWWPSSPILIGIADSVATVIVVVVTMVILKPYRIPFFAMPTLRLASSAWRRAFPLIISGSAWIVIQKFDLIILSVSGVPPSQLGEYQIALRLAEILLIVHASMLVGFVPSVSSNPTSSHESYRETALAVVPFHGVAVAALGTIAYPVVEQILGGAFAPDATVLAILSIGVGVHILTGPAGLLLIATARDRGLLRVSAVAVLANIAFNLLLIPPLAATGAAVATTASLCLLNWGYLREAWRHDGRVRHSALVVAGAGLAVVTVSVALFSVMGSLGLLSWIMVPIVLAVVVALSSLSSEWRAAARVVLLARPKPIETHR